jgi:hypothetical protein
MAAPFNIDAWNEARIQERFDASLDDLYDQRPNSAHRLWSAVDRFRGKSSPPTSTSAAGRLPGSGPLTTRRTPSTCWAASPPKRRNPIDAWLKKYLM